ncbi:MAG: hypothetical protein U9N55_07945 [candidate division Zixibacteria bacterium]|nr:hypothetical protein [candidate division Zixibacteria bacterium]
MVTADPPANFGAIFSTPSSDPVGTFDDFHVLTTDSVVGKQAGYTFSFIMASFDFGNLDKGGFVFSFPEEYDLSTVTNCTLVHSSNTVDYHVKTFELSDNMVIVTLKRTSMHSDEQDDTTISVNVHFEVLNNPASTGDYMFGGLAFKSTGSIIAGPSISEKLEILPDQPISLEITPSGNLTLKAGESITFDIAMYDSYGNLIPSSDAVWILEWGSDPIGYFSGATLHVTSVGTGRAQVRAGDMIRLSGEITVHPGNLSRLELSISPDQIVGNPLMSEARLTLWDAYGNLKTDYNLAANPIELIIGDGNLAPAMLEDNDLLHNGSIDLCAADVTYSGSSVVTSLQARTESGITSFAETVSFSGYDILEILDADGEPLQSIYPTVETLIKVIVTNNGYLTPVNTPKIEIALNGGQIATALFEPHSGGYIDTVSVTLTGPDTSTSNDLLMVTLEAEFEVGGEVIITNSQAERDVVILEPIEVSIVEGSFRPDSLYPDAQSKLAMDIMVSGHPEFVPDAWMKVAITDDAGGVETVLFDDTVGYSDILGSVISYDNLMIETPSPDILTSGWYDVVLDYAFLSDEGAYVISHKVIDSVFVLSEVEVSYVEDSFDPGIVYAGRGASFRFTINLDSEYSVPINTLDAVIKIYGNDFFTSTTLRLADSVLHPGPNLVESDSVFIPSNQQGVELHFDVVLRFMIPGTDNVLDFSTDFNTEGVEVNTAPVARIIDVELLAPNAPNVNTGQDFQVRAKVANLSGSLMGSFDIVLHSNGMSVFDSIQTVDSINADDTADILFDVVASEQPNVAEVFKVAIGSSDVLAQSPVNDVTTAVIETPAHLSFNYDLSGVEDGLVDYNKPFSLGVDLVNEGQASVSNGEYLLTIEGLEPSEEDNMTGMITEDQQVNFSFLSPSCDTNVVFTFTLTSIPTDLNTDTPAIIDDTSFTFEVTVTQLDVGLLADIEIASPNLILPGRQEELFCLTLFNRGTSEYLAASLDEISFILKGREGKLLDVSSIIDLSASTFSWNNEIVPAELSGVDRLEAIFEDLIIEPQQTCSLVFNATIRELDIDEFDLDFKSNSIIATYIRGSQTGLAVPIVTASGAPELVTQTFVIKGSSLAESFFVRYNPVDFTDRPAEFQYELAESSTVEFRVFTLTGEEVYADDIKCEDGESQYTWDGCNNNNQTVNNGVYIVSLRIVNTGETARIKLAVLK